MLDVTVVRKGSEQMEVTIKGSPKEIAALVRPIQERQKVISDDTSKPIDIDMDGPGNWREIHTNGKTIKLYTGEKFREDMKRYLSRRNY